MSPLDLILKTVEERGCVSRSELMSLLRKQYSMSKREASRVLASVLRSKRVECYYVKPGARPPTVTGQAVVAPTDTCKAGIVYRLEVEPFYRTLDTYERVALIKKEVSETEIGRIALYGHMRKGYASKLGLPEETEFAVEVRTPEGRHCLPLDRAQYGKLMNILRFRKSEKAWVEALQYIEALKKGGSQ
jgi:hypothetical protein